MKSKLLILGLASLPFQADALNLVNRHTGLYLDASGGGTVNGTPLIQSTPHGGTNQQWTLNSIGSGQYHLSGVGSGRSVSVRGAWMHDDAETELWDWIGANNQKVTVVPSTGGYSTVLFVHSGKALAVKQGSTASGAAVVQNVNNGHYAGQWKLVNAPAGYVYCADEGQVKNFAQRVDVAYGENNNFRFVNNTDGDWNFSYVQFGDPIVGTHKSGFYKTTNTQGPAGYTRCAGEGGSFYFSQAVDVAYGANGSYRYLSNVSGTVSFNPTTFGGDPIYGTVKSGWFKTRTPLPPTPPALSTANLNDFIANHARYEGGSAAAWSSEFQSFLTYMGGNVFYPKMFGPGRWTNSMLNITSTYPGAAASGGGNTSYNKNFWDTNVGQRVPVLIHEYMHHMNNGSGLSNYFNAEQADASKRWDGSGYANVSPAEYIASGFQWIVQNPTGRETVYRNHPAFYLYMVNTFIPQFYTP